MLRTGIRISECNQWRIDTLPAPSEWHPHEGVIPVWVTQGNKGPKSCPIACRQYDQREIFVPIDLAERIEHYCDFTRLAQLRRWIRSAPTVDARAHRLRNKPVRLWLSESSNQPFHNQQLYAAWTSTNPCPQGWHPHKARDFFAVETVAGWFRHDLEARNSQSLPQLSWLQAVMRDQVRLLLAPLLGHCSEETTMRYLKAAHLRLIEILGHPTLRWLDYLEPGDPA